MFDMLLESGHRPALLPSWGRGVAVALHVVILGALWRAPASPAPVFVKRVVDLPPIVPTPTKTKSIDDVPEAPIFPFEGDPAPLSPIDLSKIIGSTLSTPIPSAGNTPGPVISPLLPGDGVYLPSLVQDSPELLSAPTPAYPPLLRAAGIQGQVMVTAVVDTLGLAENGSVRIVRSDNPGFDAAALATVRAARFRPARIFGRAVRVLVQVPVVFRLN
ncbi:MAG TPA: TonB family protein [Gemmatimonadales bacterium]|nr:TonB family protein [Gemmatimonadales bacterium]